MSEHATRPPIRCYRQSALPHIVTQMLERGLTIDDYSFLRGIAEVVGCRTIGDLIRWAMEQTEAQR